LQKSAIKFPDLDRQSREKQRFFAKFLEITTIFSTLGLRPPRPPPFNPPPHYG
jgi:hypothetical protein